MQVDLYNGRKTGGWGFCKSDVRRKTIVTLALS